MAGRSNLSGGDALTWALVLGAGGFAAFKVVTDLKAKKSTSTATTGTAITGTATTGTATTPSAQHVQSPVLPVIPVASTTAPVASPVVQPVALPADPVVTTGSGTIVQPSAPVIVGGAQPPAVDISTPTTPTLPVVLLSSTPTTATVQATATARVRLTGPGILSIPEGIALYAGEVRTFTFPNSGATLQVQNSAYAWVSIASASSPNTAPPLVVGAPVTGVMPAPSYEVPVLIQEPAPAAVLPAVPPVSKIWEVIKSPIFTLPVQPPAFSVIQPVEKLSRGEILAERFANG